MMDANGEVGKSFQDINKLAIGLGNQLPGTTADFQNMMMLVRQAFVNKHLAVWGKRLLILRYN